MVWFGEVLGQYGCLVTRGEGGVDGIAGRVPMCPWIEYIGIKDDLRAFRIWSSVTC